MVAIVEKGIKTQASYQLCQTNPGTREEKGISKEQQEQAGHGWVM